MARVNYGNFDELDGEETTARQKKVKRRPDFRLSGITLCKLIKHYLSLSTGYPYFSPAYVATHIERAETQADELAEYKKTHSRTMHVIRGLLILSSTLYFCRVSTFPLIVFYETNYNNLTENLRWFSDGRVSQFGCVLSDCEREHVNAHDFARSLSALPLFTLCHTKLAIFHDLLQYLDVPGLLLATTLGYGVFLSGTIMPITNRFTPTGNLSFMFLVAPRVTRRVVQDRAQQLAQSLQKSLDNFGEKFALIELQRKQPKQQQQQQFEWSDEHLRKLERNLELELDLRVDSSTIRFNAALGLDISAAPNNNSTSSNLSQLMSLLIEGRFVSLNSIKDELARRSLAQTHPIAPALPLNRNFINNQQQQQQQQDNNHNNNIRQHQNLRQLEEIEDLYEQVDESLEQNDRQLARADYLERYTYDCVTMMRSSWWHAKAAKALAALLYTNASNLFIWVIATVYALISITHERRELFRNFSREFQSQWGCNLWVANNYTSSRLTQMAEVIDDRGALLTLGTPLDLDKLDTQFPLLRFMVAVVQASWPFSCINFFLLVYTLTNAELVVWLHELEFGLTLGAEFVRQLKPKRRDSSLIYDGGGGGEGLEEGEDEGSKALLPTNSRQRFDMDILRAQVSQLLDLKVVLIERKLLGREQQGGKTKSKLEYALATREFVTKAIEQHHLNLNSACELLEKLYINLRIFVEHVDHYGRAMTVMLTLIILYTYGYVLIGVFFVRSVENFVFVPFLIMIIGWVSANLLILVASNLHAKAKSLHVLIWSLVAVTDGCRNVKLGHMRSLWLKQVQALDNEGGLALKAWGVRITYVRIIQLIIGSGTLVVFVLRA